jgi:hypothetical protein
MPTERMRGKLPTSTKKEIHTAVEQERPFLFEILDTGLGITDNINTSVNVLSLPMAFYRYSWLSLTPPGFNRVGNLTGIVRSARARVVFEWTKEFGDRVQLAQVAVQLVEELWGSRDKWNKIISTDDPASIKVFKLQSLARAIAISTIFGLGAATIHDVDTAIRSVCRVLPLATDTRFTDWVDRESDEAVKQYYSQDALYHVQVDWLGVSVRRH